MSKSPSSCINYYACLIFIYINPQIFFLKFYSFKSSQPLSNIFIQCPWWLCSVLLPMVLSMFYRLLLFSC